MAATKKGEQPASEAEQATDRRGRRRGSGSRRMSRSSASNLVNEEETISQSVIVESNLIACDDETISQSCPEPTQDFF